MRRRVRQVPARAAAVASAAVLAAAVGAALRPASAAAEPVAFPHGTIDQSLTTTRPDAATGYHFIGRYHAAGDEHAPPPYMRKMTFYDTSGARWDTSVPARCSASDLELAAAGAAACPDGSRIGGGKSDILFMGSFQSSVDIDVFNNTDEQIMVARSPVLTTVTRGHIRPDGSVEFASPTCFPSVAGCPVDNVLQLASDVVVPPLTRSSGGRTRSYRTTAPTCPRSGVWQSTVRLWWADGSIDTVATTSPCERAAKRRSRKRRRHGRRRGHRHSHAHRRA